MVCDIILHPILPTASDSTPPRPLSLTVLYKISIDCFFLLIFFFSFLFSNTGVELIRCCAALFIGCMLIMYNWMMYACVHLALWTRCFVWKFLCIKFHSVIHACMHINYASILYLLISSFARTGCQTSFRAQVPVLCLFQTDRETEVFEWLPLQWLVIYDLFYTPIQLRPVLPTAFRPPDPPSPRPPPLLLYCSL